MNVWKHLVLVAGLLGIVGIFSPLIRTRTDTRFGPASIEITTYDLSFGLDRTHQVVHSNLPAVIDKRLSPAMREARADARIVAEASRGAVLLFVPALLMLVLGLGGIIQRRFGRVLGALALVLGLLSAGAFFGLRAGIDYGMREAGFKRTQVEAIRGSYLLAIAGALGIVAGVGALAKPQRPRVRAPQPTLPPPPTPPPPGPAPFYPPAGPPPGPPN